jgi:hypothetical protein
VFVDSFGPHAVGLLRGHRRRYWSVLMYFFGDRQAIGLDFGPLMRSFIGFCPIVFRYGAVILKHIQTISCDGLSSLLLHLTAIDLNEMSWLIVCQGPYLV